MAETNPDRIIKTLDKNLQHAVEITLFGRAALALGFSSPIAEWGNTLDIDIIVPKHLSESIEHDEQFWEAIETTNAQLAESGLFVAHIFDEEQLIIRPGWYGHRERIDLPAIEHILVYRPAAIDLILTKMARAEDPEDRQDIIMLISREQLNPGAIRDAIAEARVPDLPDILEQFNKSKEFIEKQIMR